MIKGRWFKTLIHFPIFRWKGGDGKVTKYIVTYGVEIEAEDIGKAEDLAEKGETKIKSRLEKIEGEDGEVLERVYGVE